MKIAIDARELTGKPTGVGRFLRGILTGLLEYDHPHTLRLYASERPVLPGIDRFEFAQLPRRSRAVWNEVLDIPSLLLKDGVSLYYSPGYFLPPACPVPAIFTLHDVSFFSHPEWFPTREGFKLRSMARWSARRAKGIFTVSEFSRGEILHHVRVDANLVMCARESVDFSLQSREDRDAVRRRFRLDGPLILSLGSLFQRRRTDVLLLAFRQVLTRLSDATLWIAGENRTRPRIDYERQARELGISERVIFSGYTDEVTIRDLYRAADVLAYLSEYEGFGLPPLEACACGVPVVAGRGTSLSEVFGGVASLVDPGSPDEVASAILDVLDSSDRRNEMVLRGRELAARYSPRAAAERFLELVESVMRPKT